MHANNVTSHTFFSVRQPMQAGSPELVSLCYDRITITNPEERHGWLQVVPFGGRTSTTGSDTSCSNPLALYFMPFGKTELVAGELGSFAVQNNQADLIANYFGVQTINPIIAGTPPIFDVVNGTFQSIISFNPHQSLMGVGLYYQQKLSACADKPFWLSINAPIVHVRNYLNFQEIITNPGGTLPTSGTPSVITILPGFVGSIGDALRGNTVFGNKNFLYGKISDHEECDLSTTRIADIELKIGRTYICTNHCLLDGNVGIILPTGNKPRGEFIFEPIVGNNKHFGISMGSHYEFLLHESEQRGISVWAEGVLESRYLVRNTQRRSFDLMDKQWSRYIWLYPNAQSTSITDRSPGINFLTQDVQVSPHFNFTLNTSIVVSGDCWRAEFGYNRFTRQAETVELCGCWQPGPGIVGIDAANTTILHTKSNSTMSQAGFVASRFIEVDRNPNFVPITKEMLNLESASHPALATNCFYVAAAYHDDDRCYPLLGGIGASYEFSDTNTALNRWLLWIKGAISF